MTNHTAIAFLLGWIWGIAFTLLIVLACATKETP